jgi:ribA/ribD-fused uncharacterized protein
MITEFRGDYFFLSNMYPCEIHTEAGIARSAEQAFQASKTIIPSEVKWVLEARDGYEAKRRGKKVTLRDDWNDIKLMKMHEILKLKFAHGTDLAAKLIATKDEELVEGNWWGDTFWGICGGKGENHLGKILMFIRGSLRLDFITRLC